MQRKESSAQRVEKGLMDDIAIGAIGPGERLDEVTLAKRFGVSRTPVREALNRLLAQGILVSGDRRGVRVAEYTKEELAQIFQAMHEIEVACAKMASQRLTLLDRSNIESAQASCIKAAKDGDVVAYLQANEAFHFAIYEAVRNPYMSDIAREFRRRTGPFRAKKFVDGNDLLESAANHEELLQGIFSQNSQTASEGMRQHMTDDFRRVLSSN